MATKIDASMSIYSNFKIDENSAGNNGTIFEIERFNDTLMMGVKLWNKETGKEFKFDKSISFPFDMGIRYLKTAIEMMKDGKECSPLSHTNFDKTQTCTLEVKYTKDGGVGIVCKKEHTEKGLQNFYVVFAMPPAILNAKEEVKDVYNKVILTELEDKLKECGSMVWTDKFFAKRYKKDATDSTAESDKYDDKPVENTEDFPF